MAYVQRSRCKKYELLTAFGEEPTLHIESEGDKLIHDLSVKQLDTKLTLEKQKNLEKEFVRGSGFVPLSVHDAGSSSLQQLVEKVSREEKLEKLQILGLTAKEANAVLNNEDLSFPDSNVETSVKHARAEFIKSVVESGKNCSTEESARERDVISRHEKELALAVKPESTETKLLQFALSCQNHKNVEKDLRPPEHPINQLHELERSLFCQRDPLQLINTIKRKRRQVLESSLPPYGPKFLKQSGETRRTLWDQEENVSCIRHSYNEGKLYKCKKQTFYTIRDGKIIEVDNKKNRYDQNINKNTEKNKLEVNLGGFPFVNLSSATLPDIDVTTENVTDTLSRITEEEIKNLPRFRNYEKGVPSKVLYLKNLANNVKEDDLVILFKCFQHSDKPNLIYRLMTGKMRGQAFVTFSNEKVAEEALNSINGTILKGKPVIIQFGK